MADLGDKLDDIEGLADKRFGLFGLSFTPTQLGAAFAVLSAVVGTLYSGFLMYQKVEEVINKNGKMRLLWKSNRKRNRQNRL